MARRVITKQRAPSSPKRSGCGCCAGLITMGIIVSLGIFLAVYLTDAESPSDLIPEDFDPSDFIPSLDEFFMEDPFNANGTDVYILPSIGIASFPGDAKDMTTLIKCAVGASTQANADGKGGFHFSSSDMNKKRFERLQLEATGLRPGGARGASAHRPQGIPACESCCRPLPVR